MIQAIEIIGISSQVDLSLLVTRLKSDMSKNALNFNELSKNAVDIEEVIYFISNFRY